MTCGNQSGTLFPLFLFFPSNCLWAFYTFLIVMFLRRARMQMRKPFCIGHINAVLPYTCCKPCDVNRANLCFRSCFYGGFVECAHSLTMFHPVNHLRSFLDELNRLAASEAGLVSATQSISLAVDEVTITLLAGDDGDST